MINGVWRKVPDETWGHYLWSFKYTITFILFWTILLIVVLVPWGGI